MKKALNIWAVEPGISMEEAFAAVKRAGFDGMELAMDRNPGPHSLSIETTEKELEEVCELAKKYELPVTSVCSGFWGGMMGDAAQHEQAEKYLWKTLDIAAALGVDGILIVPGGMNEEISLDSARRSCIDFLRKNKAEIERRGIFVGVENVWNGFFLSPYDMASFIDEVNSPLVGAYLDAGNMIAFSEPEYWIEVLGSRIGKVHVKDFKRKGRVNSGGDFADITHGTAKWEKIIPGLREAGYDGYLVGEVFKEFEEMSYEDYYAKVAAEMDTILVL